jgi:hypothetical protein
MTGLRVLYGRSQQIKGFIRLKAKLNSLAFSFYTDRNLIVYAFSFCSYLLLIAAVAKTVAQQTDPQFTNYIFNGLLMVAAGMDNQTQVSAIYRHQYLGYAGTCSGGPVTQIYHTSVPMKALGGGFREYGE